MLEQYQKQIIALSEKGLSGRQIAKTLNIGKTRVCEFLKLYKEGHLIVDAEIEPKTPKILIFDIETSPFMAYAFRRWKANINQEFVISEGYMLSYSAKWLGSDNIIFERITEFENDYDIVKSLSELINKADVIVAHNLMRFDLPMLKTRMLHHGLPTLEPVKCIDTLKIAKDQFRFPSNSLDGIASYLGLSRKMKHSGPSLWVKCMQLDNEAFQEMQEYNIIDVTVLEEVYLALRGWDSKSPNLALYYDDEKQRCTSCGSDHLHLLDKTSYTMISEFDSYRCGECGKISRGRTHNLRTKEQRKATLVNIM